MIRRQTAKTLAEAYHEKFRGSVTTSTVYGPPRGAYRLQVDRLYDFLYEHEYEAWFLNAAKALRTTDVRALKEFIMRLHTGESVVSVTKDWAWQQRAELGQRLLRDLAEDLLALLQAPDGLRSSAAMRRIPQLTSELELDGYIFRDGKLYYTEAAVLDTEDEEGILEKLARDLDLANQDIMKHVLRLSETHYVEERWDDSIANSRRYLESVLQEVAARLHILETGQAISRATYDRAVLVRDYVERQGLLERKEKAAIAEVYGLMSDTGSHPYIAERDQARLMRHLALTFAQFVLLRLQGKQAALQQATSQSQRVS